MVELTALQKLSAFLDPSSSVAGVDQQNAARIGERGADREAFLRAAEKPEDERKAIINRLAAKYHKEAGFEETEIGNAVDEFVRNIPSEFETTEQPETPQQLPQDQGVIGSLLNKLTERNEPNIAGRAKGQATDAVHSLQEQQFLEEFNDALEQGDQTKIVELIKNAETHKLLDQQLQLAHQHLDLLNPDELRLARLDGTTTDKEGKTITKVDNMRDEFTTQALKQAEKRKKQEERELTPAEKDAKAKQEAKEARLQAIAMDTNIKDPNRRSAAFHALLQERLAQTRPYSIFAEYYDQDLDGMLVPLSQLIQNQAQVRHRMALRQRQGVQQAVNQQSNLQNAAINAVQKIKGSKSRKGGLGSLLKGQLKKQLLSKFKKELIRKGLAWAFLSPPFVGEIVVGIILLIIIIAVIVIILFTLFSPQGSQEQQPSLQPTCTPENTCEQQLRDNGVSVRGDLSLNGDPYGKAKLVYDTLALITQSPSKFGTLLGIPAKPITLYFSGSACTGHASANGLVILSGFGACGTSVARFMLIHELSHEIAFRNPGLYNSFLNQFPRSSLTLPTYNCQFDYGVGPYPAECFADTLGEYPVYKTYRNIVGGRPSYFEHVFSSFITSFNPFYTFAKNNVYGGLEF
ncbi:MAG TPA: hypothetical protein VEW42_02835 [Candidatus Eisenbacteria bacterium]|nr:hypothetical protein [Candidatus Eisenbacteria bacterium]